MPKRSDANQQAIVDALRAAGAEVESLHEVGGGVPDLLVGWRTANYLLEVKSARGKLNERQIEWHGGWKGQVAVVRTVEDAMTAIGMEVNDGV